MEEEDNLTQALIITSAIGLFIIPLIIRYCYQRCHTRTESAVAGGRERTATDATDAVVLLLDNHRLLENQHRAEAHSADTPFYETPRTPGRRLEIDGHAPL